MSGTAATLSSAEARSPRPASSMERRTSVGQVSPGMSGKSAGRRSRTGRIVERPDTASAGLTTIGRSIGACPARAAADCPAREERALRVLREDPPLPHGDARLDQVHLEQELGSFDRPVDERRRDAETSRGPGEEVGGSGQEVDPGTDSFRRRRERDRGVLVEAHHAAVAQAMAARLSLPSRTASPRQCAAPVCTGSHWGSPARRASTRPWMETVRATQSWQSAAVAGRAMAASPTMSAPRHEARDEPAARSRGSPATSGPCARRRPSRRARLRRRAFAPPEVEAAWPILASVRVGALLPRAAWRQARLLAGRRPEPRQR